MSSMDSQDILNTSQLCLNGGFGEQVDYLLSHIRLTRWEVENLEILFHDLLKVLRQVWPGCQLNPFGSIVTGLGIKTSDVDIYVNTNLKQDPVDCVKKARIQLSKYPHIFNELLAITTAKVPIVKFYYRPTNFYSDVNFSSSAGVRNSWLLAHLLESDRRALDLAIIVKYWSKVHKLTGTNLLPNYALVLLVVFYLQKKLILPSVYNLQSQELPYIVNNWNTAYSESRVYAIRETLNTETFYELLGGFFKFYADFDFHNKIISTFLGEALNRNEFSSLERTPVQYELYRYNVTAKISSPLRIDTNICVQDPFEHCRNCTGMVFEKLYTKLMNYLKFAKNAYVEQKSDTFLRKILVDKLVKPRTKNTNRVVGHMLENKVKKKYYKAKVKKNSLEERYKWWRKHTNER